MQTLGPLALAASLVATPAALNERSLIGGWTVSEEGPVDCSLRHDMAEGRVFWMLVRTNGAYRFHVTRLKRGTGNDLRLGVDGQLWGTGSDLSEAETDAIFEGLTGGRYLELYEKNVLIDRLRLVDSAAAVERLNQCARDLEARLASEIASGTIVLQPGRTELARFRRPAVRAEGALGAHFTPAAYPRWEIEAGSEGVTVFAVEVRPDGRPGNCTITSSSGSDALDIATCRIIQTRARYTPARDEDGEAATDVVRGRVTWKIPDAGGAGPAAGEAPREGGGD